MFEEVEVNSNRWFDLTPLKNEEFRNIENFENSYQVSNYGRIKSKERENFINYKTNTKVLTKEKILKLGCHKQGYLMVNLSLNSKGHLKQVHRLVAQTFIPNVENKPEVNHKDTNKQNNRVDNLEWNTRLENQQHAEKNNLITRKKGIENTHNKKIVMYDEKKKNIKEFPSITIASLELNIPMKHLSYCLIKKRKDKYCGYYWKYLKES